MTGKAGAAIRLTEAQFRMLLEQQRQLAIRTNPSEVLDVAEVAAFLGIAESTVYKLKGSEGLPFFNAGGLKFRLDAVRQWARQREIWNVDDAVRVLGARRSGGARGRKL